VKIPNYVRTFLESNNTKEWDICVPGAIRVGKNQVEILLAVAVAAQEMGVQLKVIVVGRILDVTYLQDIKAVIEEHRKDIKVILRNHLSRAKLARIMGRSRLVIAAAKWDAAPRIAQEALCCNTPVLMNSEIICGSKYMIFGAGLQKPLDLFAQGIVEILSKHEKFQPRVLFLDYYNPEESLMNFVKVVVSQLGIDEKTFGK